MIAGFSQRTLDLLAAAGWKPGYSVDIEKLEAELGQRGYEVFPSVRRSLLLMASGEYGSDIMINLFQPIVKEYFPTLNICGPFILKEEGDFSINRISLIKDELYIWDLILQKN